ncbi:MAG: hypothetical protein DCC75_05120, partial [Proteobacteria bacterium]
MTLTLPKEAKESIEQELSTLDTVLESLASQEANSERRLRSESRRAQELTVALVTAKRVEDKQLLASDEAVSHGLRDKQDAQLRTLQKLQRKPYFARIVVEEPGPQGSRSLEYKLGFAENPECRIIDWRKAPVAKLYYEYREGDEYSEEIQGRERNGSILLRNSVEIENSELRGVACRHGRFHKKDGAWVSAEGPLTSRAAARAAGGSHHLPEIAALLSPEQFALISDNLS